MTEQTTAAQNTPPPPSEHEGYGHRITLDSMIITTCVPTFVEESTNAGTEGEPKTPEKFVANFSTSEKVAFMKQSAFTLIYVADAIEKESWAHVE